MSPTSYRTAPPRGSDDHYTAVPEAPSRGSRKRVGVNGAFLRALPKVQLHCHLEGTVQPATFLEFGRRVGLDLPKDVYAFESFEEFLLAFQAVCRALNAPDAFERIAHEYAVGAAEQGVRYAEVFISPSVWSFFHPQIDPEACVRAIRAAFDDAARTSGIELALICDLTRNFGPESAVASVRQAAGWREHGVIGIGLGGDERKFPAALFHESYALARREDLHRVAHAGEVDGAHSVRDAIEILDAERIGHGIRAVEDPQLMRLLAERKIAVEICPTSNRRTGACSPDRIHPIAELDAAGVVVTIDADDPAMFGCTLLDEYALVDASLGRAAILRFARNAIEAAFTSAERKKELLGAFAANLP
jgi:adenosine deaminase